MLSAWHLRVDFHWRVNFTCKFYARKWIVWSVARKRKIWSTLRVPFFQWIRRTVIQLYRTLPLQMCITVALLPSQICGNILKKTVDVSLQTIKNGITQGEKTGILKQTTRRLKTGIHQNDKTRICVLINSPLLQKSFSLPKSCDGNYGIPLQCSYCQNLGNFETV